VVPSSVPSQLQSKPTNPVHNPTLPLQTNRVLGLKTPAVVPQGRYRVADLEESEQECAPIAFSYQVDPCEDSNSEDSSDNDTLQPGMTVKVEFSIKNHSDGDRPGAVFTNYFPVNATYVPNSLHLEQESDDDGQPPVTVDVQGDRFIVTAPDLPADQEISGTFQLQIAPTAKNGDLLKNVFTYKDQTTPAPVAKKAEDTIGAKPCHCMGNATLPSLQVDNLVGLTVVKPGAASDSAEVGDDLTHAVTVTNLGDVPADDTQVDLVVPDVAEFSTGSIQVLPDYVDVNAAPIVPGNSLTIKLGNLRGGDNCVWHTRVRRGAPDQARIGGAVQVRCAPWGINGGYEMRTNGGGSLVVAAPVLSGSFDLLPVGNGGSGGFVAGGGLTFRGHVVNTGHGRATGFYMVPKFPRGGFRTRRISGPIGAGNSVILEVGGGGVWGECDHDIPADMAGQPLNVLGSWISDQTLPMDPAPAVIASGSSNLVAPASTTGSIVGNFSIVPNVKLTTGRDFFRTVQLGNYVYTIGGFDTTYLHGAAQSTIDQATINPDGTLSSFHRLPNGLSTPRSRFTHAVIGSYLYAIGGSVAEGPNSALSTVERARIYPDGSLGAFSGAGMPTLTTARYSPECEIVGSYLYVFGGRNLNSAERAQINPDGSIGPFSPVIATMETVLDHFPSLKIGNYLYLFGGFFYPGYYSLATIKRASISPDGSISSFSSAGQPTLPAPNYSSFPMVIGNDLYLIGGSDNLHTYRTILRSSIAPSGDLGAFAPISPGLVQSRAAFGATLIGNSLYVFGGYNSDTGTYLDSVERVTTQ
jgi:uncharacterized repeat protein (TIGR01451 family)